MCGCASVRIYIYTYIGERMLYIVSRVRVFDSVPHNSKKNVSYNSVHLYRIRSNVDRNTKEFNQSLRGSDERVGGNFSGPIRPTKIETIQGVYRSSESRVDILPFPTTEEILNFKCGCACMCVRVHAFTHSAKRRLGS